MGLFSTEKHKPFAFFIFWIYHGVRKKWHFRFRYDV